MTLGRMENKGDNIFGGCLVGEKGGKKLVEPKYFLIDPTKMFSLQNREKTEWKMLMALVDEDAHVQSTHGFHSLRMCIYFFFLVFSPFDLCFSVIHYVSIFILYSCNTPTKKKQKEKKKKRKVI